MERLVLASGNAGKLRELTAVLAPLQIEVVPQSAFDVPTAEETGTTFVENAIIKARHAARHCALPALADDSGLLVDALGGAPGVHSARYAGPFASDADNVARLLGALTDLPTEERTASFYCVLVLMRSEADPMPLLADGRWPGRITTAPTGDGGFGYDPVFVPDGYELTAAQLGAEEKNRVSHRAQALASLAELMQARSGG
ncbi:MAG: RdgB/HAM1 family non-canonical purine NTP pyrophosphatase [Pseudomonadota bacterium]